jgi:hypothetical protein
VKLKLSQDDSQKHPQNTRWQAGGFSLIMDKKMINTYHSCSGSVDHFFIHNQRKPAGLPACVVWMFL